MKPKSSDTIALCVACGRQTVEKKKTERGKVIELLKAQFNIEPKVVFPRCKTKQTVGAHLPSESESGQKREHLESVTSSGRPL